MSHTLFSNTRWAVNHESFISLSATGVPRPDNTPGGTFQIFDVDFTINVRYLRGWFFAPRTSTYTLSFFARANPTRYIYISYDGVTGYIDLSNGSVSSPSGGTISTRQATVDFPTSPTASGWYRVWVTKTLTGSTLGKFLDIYPRSDTTGTTTSRAGVNPNGVLIWGAMLEETNSITTYIPTPNQQQTFENNVDVTSSPSFFTPVLRVSANNHFVAYWANKSLSASVVGLSGLHVYEENSPFRPTYNVLGNLSSVYFDVDYLSTSVLITPLSTAEQTVFVAARYGDDTLTDIRFRQNVPMFSQILSGVSGAGDTGTYTPLVRPAGNNTCMSVGLTSFERIPLNNSWLYRNPGGTAYNTASYFIEENNNQFNVYRSTKTATNTYRIAYNRFVNEYLAGTRNSVNFTLTENLTCLSAVDVIRLGTSIGRTMLELRDGFGWTLANSFRDSGGGNSTGNKGQYINYGEIIFYNRALTQEEINDVETYLYTKWRSNTPREVWALDNGLLSSSSIFSISGEPAPFNTLLSSDFIFTNGYTLTAVTDQLVNKITNARTPVTGRAGGHVVMSQGVTLSASIVGGTAPYTVLVPSNTTCSIVGAVYGGSTYHDNTIVLPISTSFNSGVFIDKNATLYLSGSIYGGFNERSIGVGIDGGTLFYASTGVIQGSGIQYSLNAGYQPYGGLSAYGVSAINTFINFTNNRVQQGLNSAGVYTNNCNILLKNCAIEAVLNNGGTVSHITNAPANLVTGGVCMMCENTGLTAVDTMFLSVTSSAILVGTGQWFMRVSSSNRHAGTALWARSSSNLIFTNCYLEGPRRLASNGDDFVNTRLGNNQAVRLSTNTVLSGTSCKIFGARNSNTDLENTTGKVGLYIDEGCVAQFTNTDVNNEAITRFNRGIHNVGFLGLTGTKIRGGYRAVGTSFPGIYNRGTLVAVNADIAPNYSGSQAIDNESNGTAYIFGKIAPGGPICNTITSRGLLSAWYTEPFISSIRGFVPIQALHCVFIPLCSDSLYSDFSVDGVLKKTVFFDKNYTLDLPLSTNVLKDYVFGPNNSLTGTSIIPEVSTVIIGVPVRSIFGTVRPITVDAFWNQPITSIQALSSTYGVELSTTIFNKFINPMTSVSLSAIVRSLTDIPPPLQ
jgi:hypothetical protein